MKLAFKPIFEIHDHWMIHIESKKKKKTNDNQFEKVDK